MNLPNAVSNFAIIPLVYDPFAPMVALSKIATCRNSLRGLRKHFFLMSQTRHFVFQLAYTIPCCPFFVTSVLFFTYSGLPAGHVSVPSDSLYLKSDGQK